MGCLIECFVTCFSVLSEICDRIIMEFVQIYDRIPLHADKMISSQVTGNAFCD